jgi:hypothetical protein
MEPMAARALLAIALSSENRKKLRSYEKTLPPGKYLQGGEICRLFKLTPKTASDEDIRTLEQMWHEYNRRVLWKKNKIEEKRHEVDCVKKCICKTRQEEVHDWEDFAMQNFDKAWISIDWGEAYVEEEREPQKVLASLGVRSKRV